jgi:hypothetical protein
LCSGYLYPSSVSMTRHSNVGKFSRNRRIIGHGESGFIVPFDPEDSPTCKVASVYTSGKLFATLGNARWVCDP